MKKGIMIVAASASRPATRRAFERIEARAKRRFKGWAVLWACDSETARRKRREAEFAPSALSALAEMRREGFDRVAAQPLRVVAGAEYERFCLEARFFAAGGKGPEKIEIGQPLLGSSEDLSRVAKELLAGLPAARKKNEAVIFVGHGNGAHPGDLAYLAAASALRRLDKLAFLATLKGRPTIGDVVRECKAAGAKKAYLLPFMATVGNHALNDIAGDGEGSSKSALTAAGIECVPVLKGMAERDGLVDVWLDHLASAVERLSERDQKSEIRSQKIEGDGSR